eukprot:jgi/Tetstr1/442753/TSEL_030841.t2
MGDVEARDTTLVTKAAQLVMKPDNIDGTLTVSHQYVRWVAATAGKAQPIALSVALITGQQRAKGKPFLRIVSSSGSPVIFQFSSEADRDAAVDILAPLTSGGKPAPTAAGEKPGRVKITGADAALKEKLLAHDRDLKALYDQIIQQGVLTDAEFWAGRQHLLNKAKGSDLSAQKAGLSTTMLADVQPSADGQTNRVTFRITPEMVPQIFSEKPEVHRCYLANVPHTLTEQEFWGKYARYEWARRIRQLNRKAEKKDTIHLSVEDQENLEMFQQFRKSEQTEKEARLKARQALPAVNLAADGYDALSSGYGMAFNGGKEGMMGLSKASAALDIIRDVNRHAAVVLDGIDAAPSSDTGAVAAALAKSEQQKMGQDDPDWDKTNHEKWAAATLQEGRALEDLAGRQGLPAEPLSIQDPRRYFDATPDEEPAAPARPGAAGAATLPDLLASLKSRMLPCPAVKPALAFQVLTEISLRVQAAVAEQDDGYMTGDPKDVLLPALQNELRKQAMMANELLRHFWALFPVSSAARAKKLERLKDALSKQYDHLQAMQEAAHGSDRIYISQVLRPCMQALDAAFTKYDAEQTLRASKKPRVA